MRRLLNAELKTVQLPGAGVVMSGRLATRLGVRPGETVWVEFLQGKRAVQIPRRGGLEAMVESGLQPGEQVITYPGDRVADGARVKPR